MTRQDDSYFSDEQLNALVDGEYAQEERTERLHRIHQDQEVTKAYCKLRSVKEMVQAAYDQPGSEQPLHTRKTGWKNYALAASVACVAMIVALALASGLKGITAPAGSTDRFALIDPDGRGQAPAVAANEEMRIVFHVVNSTKTHAGELLSEVENVLQDYRTRGEKLRVEVVAHSAGLDLLREKLSTQKDRIAQLAEDFPNLAFVACGNTVERIAVSEGIEVLLVPQATLTGSGVSHVVKRQRQGWVYIQV